MKKSLSLTLKLGMIFGLLSCLLAGPAAAGSKRPVRSVAKGSDASAQSLPEHVDAKHAFEYVKEIVAIGRRAPGSEGHRREERLIYDKLKQDTVENDVFEASTPAGKFQLKNIIAKFAGTSNDIIVVASHYDTCYPLKDFVGANDGGSSTGLLLEIADRLRGKKLPGPSVWLVFFDGEEAFKDWSANDSLYGSRHLAAKWQQDGTNKRIKAFLLLDMVGDADLNIDHDANSDQRLEELVGQAATQLGYASYFFERNTAIEDDHLPFAKLGVPTADIIDLNYGYNNVFHHSPQDTMDKLSPKSLQITGDVVLKVISTLER